ncbi:MAG: O-antigen ligase family protein [Planctomycetes bacterium]|nr:O-antigen ligase family protein [Planctomycetota bacterium]
MTPLQGKYLEGPGKYLLILCFVAMLGFLNASPSQSSILFFIVGPVAFLILLIRPILGLYITVFITPLYSPKVGVGFANMSFHQMIILVTVTIATTMILIRRHGPIKNEVNLPLSLFIISAIISTVNSPDLGYSIKWFLFLGVFFSSYLLTLIVIHEIQQLNMILILLVLSCFFLCSIALFSYLQSPNGGRLSAGLVLDNPNSLGNYLSLILPFLLALLFHWRAHPYLRMLSWVGIFLMFFLLLQTYSRSSWLGTTLGCACVFSLHKVRSAILFIAALICLAIFMPDITQRATHIDASVMYRLEKIQYATKLLQRNYVLGNGLGSFQKFAEQSSFRFMQTHSSLENMYALILVEQGILGLSALILLSFIFVYSTIRRLKRSTIPMLRGIILGSLGSYIAMLGCGFGEAILQFPKYNYFIGIILALPVIAARLETQLLEHLSIDFPDTLDGNLPPSPAQD